MMDVKLFQTSSVGSSSFHLCSSSSSCSPSSSFHSSHSPSSCHSYSPPHSVLLQQPPSRLALPVSHPSTLPAHRVTIGPAWSSSHSSAVFTASVGTSNTPPIQKRPPGEPHP